MSGDVVIVGGGPAGLAAAVELRRRGVRDVAVLERDHEAGGIPRQLAHPGFGIRDLHRVMTGPAYARHHVALARSAGVDLRTGTMVVGWDPAGGVQVVSRQGREVLRPAAVLLATGCRERPRSARLIPGSRAEGVMTTGTLQQLVERGLVPVGSRAVVAGAEHVSFSALEALARGGARTLYMTTEHTRHQSLEVFRIGARLRYRTPVLTRTRITAIHGHQRVEAVELGNLDSGATRRVACDTVVFTADWIPDHELAISRGLDIDPETRGPAIDAGFRTSQSAIYAAGNVLHGAETHDVAAAEGRAAAAEIALFLSGSPAPPDRAPIVCAEPLGWIYPNTLSGAGPPVRGYRLRAHEFLSRPRIVVRQDGRTLWEGRPRRVQPGRSVRLPATLTRGASPVGGAITVSIS